MYDTYTLLGSSPRERPTLGIKTILILFDILSYSSFYLFVAKPKITCLGKNGLPTADACKRDIITEETDPLMVNCVAESIPPPTFEWKMQNKSNPTGSYIPLPTRIVQNFLSNGSLQLKAGAVQRSDQNIYRCIAKNKLGQAEADFNLTVLGELLWLMTG